ncbi:MAG: hypothetical protein HON90_11085, partial [Halobacteriovoraceae bacterium]|nr:hypothetical protein [Halobacteriovoraceae bacterium]
LKKVDAKFVQKLAKIEKRKIIISEKNLSGCKSNFFSLIQRKSVILNKKISEQKTYFTTNEFVKNNKTPTCVEEVVLALNPNKPVNVYINNVKVYGENLSDDQFTSSLEYYDSSDKLKHSIRYLKSNFTGVRFINLLDEVSSSNQMDFINEIFSEETKKINIELVEQTLNKVSSSYHIDTINAMIDSVNNQNSAQTLISLLNIISSSNQVEVLNIFITRNKLSQSQSSSEMIRLLNLFYSSDQQKVIANLVDNKLIQSPLAVNEIISFIDLGSSVYMLETLESLLPIIDKEQLSKSDVKLIADQFSSFDQADVYEILL